MKGAEMETEERIVLAQSVYTPSCETNLQLYRGIRRTWRIVLLCLLYGALFSVLLVRIGFNAVKIIAFDLPVYAAVSMWVSGVMLLVFAFIFVRTLIAPRRNAKRRMRQLLETHPAVPSITQTFYADEVVMKTADERNGAHLAYSVFRKVTETNDLFLLWTKEKQVFPVAKQGLTVTDVPGFRALIREKCPKAKCRLRKENNA